MRHARYVGTSYVKAKEAGVDILSPRGERLVHVVITEKKYEWFQTDAPQKAEKELN